MTFKVILPLLVLDCFLLILSGHAMEAYDFIIVGGGTAGSVLAARLSETWKVILIEAGGENNVPRQVKTSVTYQGTDLDWHYETEPQDNSCLGLKDRKLFWPAGKILGGTSEINYMIYTRGNKKDYDLWAEKGNPGWSYDEVLPYFLKFENYNFKKFNKKWHNVTGPMNIQHFHASNLTSMFLNAAKQLGYPIGDYNGKEQMRFSKVKANIRKRRRHGVYKAFLKSTLTQNRENLVILTSAQVTKVIIEHNDTATGVEYVRNGKIKKAYARREVILSAGVVGSTKILLLSGIGSKQDLENLQIPVVKDLPVGKGIKDHISYFGLNYLTNFQPNYNTSCSELNRCKGLSPDGIEAIGFVEMKKGGNIPDVEILLVNHVITRDIKNLTNMDEKFYKKVFQPVEKHIAINIFPILLHPRSKGFIKLRSKNYSEAPIIQPNYLSDEEDIKKMVQAIKFVKQLEKVKSFRKVNADLYPTPVCDESATDSKRYWDSEEYWRCAVKTLTMSFNDYMGGCTMGPSTDSEAVVDDRLQVHGLRKLMVVDASVIPVTISGHIGAATIMVAEKAADLIKEKHGSVWYRMVDMLYDIRDAFI